MKTFFRNPIVITGIVIAIIITISIYFFSRDDGIQYNITVVERGELIQEVNVTGRIEPQKEVDLVFKGSGRVASVSVDVADSVFVGQILVSLDSSELYAELASLEAALAIQNAELSELRSGTRPEEIDVQEARVQNARAALEGAKKDIINKLQDSYTKSDDAIRHRVDQFISNPKSSNPELDFLIADSALESKIESGRVIIESIFTSWSTSLASLTITSDFEFYANTSKQNLSEIKSFLDDASLAVNGLTPSGTLTQATIDGWKTDVSTARVNINTAITNLSATEEKLNTSKTNLLIEENSLILKKAGSTPEAIQAKEAAVKQAEAMVRTTKVKIGNNILRSPINGIVTTQEAKVGEVLAVNAEVVAIMSATSLKIEVYIPEADIAKVKIGDVANMTLDAYGDDVIFKARVIMIDPAETLIEGVASYNTTLELIDADERILPGMTANLDIITMHLYDIIIAPSRSIISKMGSKFVRVLEGGVVVEKEVKTGTKGSDGNIEILEGLSVGDKVITSVKSK